jgi:hypothetical protein
VLAPVNKLKIRDPDFTNVIDLQLHKRIINNDPSQVEYFLYVISTKGVLLYSHVEKREDCKTVNDEWDSFNLTPNCTDLNSQGVLLVDAAVSK